MLTFLVCQDVADVDLLAIEVDRGNESIFVSADVEHDEIADPVCTWKCRSQSGKSWKVILLHNFEPARQRIFAVWMHRPKLTQHFARDDVHSPIVSQNEIFDHKL